jgi:hypothetical protein
MASSAYDTPYLSTHPVGQVLGACLANGHTFLPSTAAEHLQVRQSALVRNMVLLFIS